MVPMIKTNIIWTNFLNNEIWTFVKRKSRFRKEPAQTVDEAPLLRGFAIVRTAFLI